jgi:hypothetical protein
LDIPDKELTALLRYTRAKTKREAIVTAIKEFNRRRRIAALVKYAGTSKTFTTSEELLKLRRSE